MGTACKIKILHGKVTARHSRGGEITIGHLEGSGYIQVDNDTGRATVSVEAPAYWDVLEKHGGIPMTPIYLWHLIYGQKFSDYFSEVMGGYELFKSSEDVFKSTVTALRDVSAMPAPFQTPMQNSQEYHLSSLFQVIGRAYVTSKCEWYREKRGGDDE